MEEMNLVLGGMNVDIDEDGSDLHTHINKRVLSFGQVSRVYAIN